MFNKLGYQTTRATEGSTESLSRTIENISNMKSIGYKKNQTTFIETLNGEIARHETKDFSQGLLRRTGEVFDLALNGPGFFEIELPSGQRAYSRVGNFRLSGEGELVTADEGYRVIPLTEEVGKPLIGANKDKKNALGLNIELTTPKLIISPDLVPEITENGTVNGINPESGEKRKIGRINVVAFNNPQGLESVGKGFYLPTKLSGQVQDIEYGPNNPTQVKQGYLEYGNVDIAQEMMDLSQMKSIISAQFKVLKVIDKLYEQVNYTIGKSV
jgi:flagellar basal-body rod protein FlgG